MKKLLFTLCLMTASWALSAQNFAYVDSQYIMENMPEFQEAQSELDKMSKTWQDEIEKRYREIEELYKTFQAEQVLLTDEMRLKREEEIIEKEKAVQEFQREKFGVEGELFKKRQELLKPIQQKIYDTIKEVANAGNYEVIFDRSEQSNILFAEERLDKSDSVLRKLGVKKGVK